MMGSDCNTADFVMEMRIIFLYNLRRYNSMVIQKTRKKFRIGESHNQRQTREFRRSFKLFDPQAYSACQQRISSSNTFFEFH